MVDIEESGGHVADNMAETNPLRLACLTATGTEITDERSTTVETGATIRMIRFGGCSPDGLYLHLSFPAQSKVSQGQL